MEISKGAKINNVDAKRLVARHRFSLDLGLSSTIVILSKLVGDGGEGAIAVTLSQGNTAKLLE